MEIFIIESAYDYSGSAIQGVYSTVELAEAAFEKMIEDDHSTGYVYDSYYISKITLGVQCRPTTIKSVHRPCPVTWWPDIN